MKRYVNGFMYSNDKKRVVLIRKNQPQWQKGYLNGVGGKIELNETPQQAIVREFEEETGVVTDELEWTLFSIIRRDLEYEVYFFFCVSDKVYDAKTTEAEEIGLYEVSRLPNNVIANLKWLIPISLDNNIEYDKPLIIKHR